MTTSSLEATIASHPLTRGMTERHRRLLAENAMEVAFVPGEQVFRTGDDANRFYLVLDGAVQIKSLDARGKPVVIQEVRGGEVLGWSWLFPPYTWNFDAQAIAPTRAIFFYGTRLRAQCDEDHDFGYEMMKRMSQILLERLQSTRRQMRGTG